MSFIEYFVKGFFGYRTDLWEGFAVVKCAGYALEHLSKVGLILSLMAVTIYPIRKVTCKHDNDLALIRNLVKHKGDMVVNQHPIKELLKIGLSESSLALNIVRTRVAKIDSPAVHAPAFAPRRNAPREPTAKLLRNLSLVCVSHLSIIGQLSLAMLFERERNFQT